MNQREKHSKENSLNRNNLRSSRKEYHNSKKNKIIQSHLDSKKNDELLAMVKRLHSRNLL